MSTITKKTPAEIRALAEGGKILAAVLRKVSKKAKPGVTLKQLDEIASEMLDKKAVESSFRGYTPQSNLRPFPAVICTSLNWTVVHGIPGENILKQGDLLSLDLGVRYKNLFTDSAITVGIGTIPPKFNKLLNVTRRALDAGIKAAKLGNTTGDIGFAIQQVVQRAGFAIIRELVGHGVGYAVHEPPFVPNFGSPKSGIKLAPGMVIAIEPMVTTGSGEIEMSSDGSFITKDRAPAAHFEHTVAITKRGPIILTK